MYLYQVRNDQRPPSAGQGVLVSAVAGHSLIFRIIFQLFDTVLVLLNINIDRSLFSIE